ILVGFCRWAALRGKQIRPNTQTIECYQRYLKEYEAYYFKQHSEPFADQLEQYRQEGIPDLIGQRWTLMGSLQDFPLIVSMATEIKQDFMTVLMLFDEITGYLGLDKIHEHLAARPLQDDWERKVVS